MSGRATTPFVVRVHRWVVPLPADATRAPKRRQLSERCALVVQHNPDVADGEVTEHPDGAMVSLSVRGRDQYHVKGRAPYAVAGVVHAVLGGVTGVRLVAVERPEDRRRTRVRASDGRHNAPGVDEMISYENLIPEVGDGADSYPGVA